MKHILIAAKDRALSHFVAEALLDRAITAENPTTAGNGFDISRAHSTLEVELLLTRTDRHFDALMLDTELPGKDTLDLLAGLEAADPCDLPVLLMGERGQDAFTRQLALREFDIAGFIDKPITATALRDVFSDLDRRRTVVVIEPDATLRDTLRRQLAAVGYRVLACASADAGLEQVGRETPDGVVAAVGLGPQSGLHVCVQLKEDPDTARVPILLYGKLESMDQAGIAENAHRADDFLNQPFVAADLVDRVRALVGRAPGARSSSGALGPRPPATFDDSAPVTGDLPRSEPSQRPSMSPPPSASPSPREEAHRATRRVPCHLQVRLQDGGTVYESETLNISDGGIMILTAHPLENGMRMALEFQLPDIGDPIQAEGKVAWVGTRSGRDGAAAVGIKFSKIEAAHLETIVNYVNRLAKVVYVAP